MSDFSELRCEACQAEAPPATADELGEFQRTHSKWERNNVDGIPRISRIYGFRSFIDALEFTNCVGQIAEEEGHHPALLTEWGRVTVSWWTHKIRNLHRNDLIMGAKTDNLYDQTAVGQQRKLLEEMVS